MKPSELSRLAAQEIYVSPTVESETFHIEKGFASSENYGDTGSAGDDLDSGDYYDL
jgi:hypothetical protein